MQTTKKSKIFLALLFLAALFFVSCSFEDTLGTYGRNTNTEENGVSGGGNTGGGNSGGGSSGGNTGGGGSGENNGSSIPQTYHGKYTKVGRDTSYITVGNDNIKGDYIMIEGGNKEYVKDLVYMGENSWKQLVSTSGYYSTTWQYTLKTENNIRKFYFIIISTFTDTERNFVRSSTNSVIQYWHN